MQSDNYEYGILGDDESIYMSLGEIPINIKSVGGCSYCIFLSPLMFDLTGFEFKKMCFHFEVSKLSRVLSLFFFLLFSSSCEKYVKLVEAEEVA
ncbi:hypothetical protein RHMOL_Rhmol06G0318500 [Rhododendron molle]|uniref:Uncharacterized protein n=1 Tax=Rhododendron molle TaxID=49168 RepID=A0ACC0NJ93_RHOML|nr:hypothetical protein RHMOL_Rhmol06G0318500 [Rhododendron molle]